MADISYRLIVELATKGSLQKDIGKVADASGGLEKVKNAAANAGGSIDKAGDALKNLGSTAIGVFEGAVERVASFTAGLAKVGAGVGIAAVAYGVGHLNAELEKTTVSLASVFNAQGAAKGMENGMQLAGNVIKDMRKDAAMLPGEFQDLLGFFRLGAAPGLGIGASVPQLEKLSANAMAAAASTGMNMDQAAREFAQLLQGRSGSHNVFGSMLGITGESSKKFNAASGEARLKILETEFGKYSDSIAVFGTTFDALTSSLTDSGKSFLQKSTKPLFDSVKVSLGEANHWIDTHADTLDNIAGRIGNGLQVAFEAGKQKLLEWGPILLDFVHAAGDRMLGMWEKASPLLEKLETYAKIFLRHGGTEFHHGGADSVLDGMGTASKLYGGIQMAKMAAPMLAPVGEAIAGSGPAGWAAAAALLVAIGGAIHVLTDETSEYHEKAVMIAESIKTHFGGTAESLSNAFTKMSPELLTLVDIMGTSLLLGIQGFAVELDALAKVLDGATSIFIAAKVALGFQGLHTINEAVDPNRQAVDVASRTAVGYLNGYDAAADAASKKTDKKTVHGHGGTSIQKVEIVVSSNQDPSRIARLTAKELTDLARNPTSSRHVKNWSAARPG
jgi:hypothetical protein